MSRSSIASENTVARHEFTQLKSSRDLAIVSIDAYWQALTAWRCADRQIKYLQKRLSEDVMRLPRVQVAHYLRGEVKEPIYVHSEWAIKDHVRTECKQQLSIWTGPGWVHDPKAKNGWRKEVSERSLKQRPIIRAKYKLRERTKIAEFLADKTELYARQRAVGWRQAVELEEQSRSLVFKLRYRAQETKPTTLAGAIALIEFISAAQSTLVNSRNTEAPYGLGDYYPAHIAKNVARFLRDARVVAVVQPRAA